MNLLFHPMVSMPLLLGLLAIGASYRILHAASLRKAQKKKIPITVPKATLNEQTKKEKCYTEEQ